MHDSFWWNKNITNLLFDGYTIKSTGGLIGTCFMVALLSFLFELLKYLQAKQRQSELLIRSKQLKTICSSESSTLLTNPPSTTTNPDNPLNITLIYRFFLVSTEVGLWFILQNVGYILMLIIMVFNGWLFLSAVIGGGIGYLIFGHLFIKINVQNCQILRDTYCKLPICDNQEKHTNSTSLSSSITSKEGESTALQDTNSTSNSNNKCHHQVTIHDNCDKKV